MKLRAETKRELTVWVCFGCIAGFLLVLLFFNATIVYDSVHNPGVPCRFVIVDKDEFQSTTSHIGVWEQRYVFYFVENHRLHGVLVDFVEYCSYDVGDVYVR